MTPTVDVRLLEVTESNWAPTVQLTMAAYPEGIADRDESTPGSTPRQEVTTFWIKTGEGLEFTEAGSERDCSEELYGAAERAAYAALAVRDDLEYEAESPSSFQFPGPEGGCRLVDEGGSVVVPDPADVA